jgi:hypothetical protein
MQIKGFADLILYVEKQTELMLSVNPQNAPNISLRSFDSIAGKVRQMGYRFHLNEKDQETLDIALHSMADAHQQATSVAKTFGGAVKWSDSPTAPLVGQRRARVQASRQVMREQLRQALQSGDSDALGKFLVGTLMGRRS